MLLCISIEYNIKGPVYTLSTACAAGADAIGLGLSLIQNGTIDAAIVGGAEAPLAPMTFGSFCNVGAFKQSKL